MSSQQDNQSNMNDTFNAGELINSILISSISLFCLIHFVI